MDQIRTRVDWVFHAGFDFLTTESGLSEFTHPDCSLMLDLLNEFATYVNKTWGKEAGVKVHCSAGQTCGDYIDSRTGEPINFNFLPMLADASLGVFPHTVQAREWRSVALDVYLFPLLIGYYSLLIRPILLTTPLRIHTGIKISKK